MSSHVVVAAMTRPHCLHRGMLETDLIIDKVGNTSEAVQRTLDRQSLVYNEF